MGWQRTRWADDCVIVGTTRQEAHRALTGAQRFLQEERGVVRHPQQTRIVPMRQGCAFLGDQVQQGKGHRVPDAKRPRRCNPQNLSAVPRDQSVTRLQERIRSLTRRKAPLTLTQVIARVNPVMRGWGTFSRKAHIRGLVNQRDRWRAHRL